jgi:hypothetical protein
MRLSDDFTRRTADHERIGRHVADDNRAGADHRTGADMNVGNYIRARAKERIGVASDLPGEVAPRRDMHPVRDAIVMVQDGPGIDDRESTDSASGVDDRACHDDRTIADLDVAREDCAWVHRSSETSATREQAHGEFPSEGAVADADDDRMAGEEVGAFEIAAIADDGDAIDHTVRRPIIQETGDRHARGSQNVGNDAPVPAASEDSYRDFIIQDIRLR